MPFKCCCPKCFDPYWNWGVIVPALHSSPWNTAVRITDWRGVLGRKRGPSANVSWSLDSRESLGNVREKLRAVPELERKNGSETGGKQEHSRSLAPSPPYTPLGPPLKASPCSILGPFFSTILSATSANSFFPFSFIISLFFLVWVVGVLLHCFKPL